MRLRILVVAALAAALGGSVLGCGGGDEPSAFEEQVGLSAAAICRSLHPDELARAMGVSPARSAVADAVARRAVGSTLIDLDDEILRGEVERPSGKDLRTAEAAGVVGCTFGRVELRSEMED